MKLMHFNFITGNEIMTFMKFSLLYTWFKMHLLSILVDSLYSVYMYHML